MHKKKDIKLCPFLGRDCEGEACALYNELIGRCEWGLMTYNLWHLSNSLKQNFEQIK